MRYVEHWQDLVMVMSVARHSLPVKEIAIILIVPAVSVYGSFKAAERASDIRDSYIEQRITNLERKVDDSGKIITYDHALVERWGLRLDKLEAQHEHIMHILLSTKKGSGYTYFPEEIKR